MTRYVFSCMVATCAAAVLTFSAAQAQPTAVSNQAQPAAASHIGAYYISEFELKDPAGIRPYSEAVESTFRPFGGRYVVRGGRVSALEGAPTKRLIMIGFPSVERAQAWYSSCISGHRPDQAQVCRLPRIHPRGLS